MHLWKLMLRLRDLINSASIVLRVNIGVIYNRSRILGCLVEALSVLTFLVSQQITALKFVRVSPFLLFNRHLTIAGYWSDLILRRLCLARRWHNISLLILLWFFYFFYLRLKYFVGDPGHIVVNNLDKGGSGKPVFLLNTLI